MRLQVVIAASLVLCACAAHHGSVMPELDDRTAILIALVGQFPMTRSAKGITCLEIDDQPPRPSIIRVLRSRGFNVAACSRDCTSPMLSIMSPEFRRPDEAVVVAAIVMAGGSEFFVRRQDGRWNVVGALSTWLS